MLLAAAVMATAAQAQDSRTVLEPVVPPACSILVANRDGSDTARIQAAIDQCAPGHAVRLSASNELRSFRSGPLTLRSGVTLLIDAGATLLASTRAQDYDLGKGSCGTIDHAGKGCRVFISADGTTGSGIMGEGTIDGQGGHLIDGQSESWWQIARRAQKENASQNVPRLIQLRNASNFTLYRITLRNSPNFYVAMSGVDGFTAWGVKIDTPADARNTDGIDPGSSRNITIAHSFIRTGDDNVAIKGGSAGLTENVSILHNHFYNGHGMSIGSETVGGVRHVLVDDLTMDGSVSGLRIKSDAGRGGLVNDVRYRNVCLRKVRNPIELITRYERRSEGSKIPSYRDISFEHVYSTSAGRVLLQGFDADHPLRLSFVDTLVPGEQLVEHVQQSGAITNAAGACEGRFLPFPEPEMVNTRPQLNAAQAAHYSYAEVLKAGADGKPWDPLADPLASGAPFKADYLVDATVRADGVTTFNSVQAALDHAIANGSGNARVYIELKPGLYHGLVYVPEAPFPITLYSREPDARRTRIRADIDAGLPAEIYARRFGPQFTRSPAAVQAMFAQLKALPNVQTPGAMVLWVKNSGFQMRNITVENYHSSDVAHPDCTDLGCLAPLADGRDSRGQDQAVAMLLDGADRAQFENVRFIGFQDTLFLRTPVPTQAVRSFFHNSYVQGDVDYIFGNSTAYFYRSEIRSMGSRHASSYVTAPSTSMRARYGFVFNECSFTNDGSPAALSGTFRFARQWFNGQRCTPYGTLAGVDGYSCTLGETNRYQAPRGSIDATVLESVGQTVILNSVIGAHISKLQPWSDWNKPGALPYRPAQYDSDGFWSRLRRAGIEPSRLNATPGPNQAFLAEFNNTDKTETP
ncbi:MAG: pectinesterase family protein [Pseudomonadota bacterium]